jgi:hypothetical protein
MYRIRLDRIFVSMVLLTLPLCGCQPSTPDDQEQTSSDAPKTYAAAVARLQTLSDDILEACLHGDPKDADAPLHEVGHVIRAAPKLAQASDASADDLAAIQSASDQLFAAFDKIHGTMHVTQSERENVDFEAIGAEVKTALATLQSKVELVGDAEVDVEVERDDHDHDHEEGEEDHDHEGDVGDDQ